MPPISYWPQTSSRRARIGFFECWPKWRLQTTSPDGALTRRIRNNTFEHMKVAMDSDCLIKLAKAGLNAPTDGNVFGEGSRRSHRRIEAPHQRRGVCGGATQALEGSDAMTTKTLRMPGNLAADDALHSSKSVAGNRRESEGPRPAQVREAGVTYRTKGTGAPRKRQRAR